MKCAVCGKEFGNGANCKNCGTDRVTGLGNYGGYTAPSNSSANVESSSRRENPHQIVDNEPKIVKVSSMICHACGEIIPADSKFCPHCSTSLYVTCPKCGHEYSSQYPACSKCGTNRNDYIEKQKELAEAERKRKQELEISVSRIKEKQLQKEQTPEGREELRREKEVLDSYRAKWSKERIEREKRMREAAEEAEKNRQERERIKEEEIQKRRQEREERVRKREKEAAEAQRKTGCLYMLILAPFAVILLMCLGLLFS
jgi:valyl-tRNA synthetase